jgi:hypothetical protein
MAAALFHLGDAFKGQVSIDLRYDDITLIASQVEITKPSAMAVFAQYHNGISAVSKVSQPGATSDSFAVVGVTLLKPALVVLLPTTHTIQLRAPS